MAIKTLENDYIIINSKKDLFKNITNIKELQNKAYDYILNGNKNYETIIDTIDGKEIKFRRISAQEYVYGRNNKHLDEIGYQKKMRIAPAIDILIKNANIKYFSPLTHPNKLFSNGFNNYQGKVLIDNIMFRYIVRIGKAKDDNIFYDISLINKN